MPLRPVALGALAIVAFDLLASIASRTLGFPYDWATPGSWLIYAAVGFVIGRQSDMRTASAGAAVVALVDATIGWAISWAIGPGRLPDGSPGIPLLIAAVIFLVITGAVIGAVAGLLARRFRVR
jgi:hypothetical protein